MANCECPYCDFTGSVDSVEGHISARTDDEHAGELGRYHREQLLGRVEDGLNSEENSERYSEGLESVATSGVPVAGIVLLVVVLAVVFALKGDGDQGESDQPDEDSSGTEEIGTVPMVEG